MKNENKTKLYFFHRKLIPPRKRRICWTRKKKSMVFLLLIALLLISFDWLEFFDKYFHQMMLHWYYPFASQIEPKWLKRPRLSGNWFNYASWLEGSCSDRSSWGRMQSLKKAGSRRWEAKKSDLSFPFTSYSCHRLISHFVLGLLRSCYEG